MMPIVYFVCSRMGIFTKIKAFSKNVTNFLKMTKNQNDGLSQRSPALQPAAAARAALQPAAAATAFRLEDFSHRGHFN